MHCSVHQVLAEWKWDEWCGCVAAADKIDGLGHSRHSKSTPRTPHSGQNCPQNAEKFEFSQSGFVHLWPTPGKSCCTIA